MLQTISTNQKDFSFFCQGAGAVGKASTLIAEAGYEYSVLFECYERSKEDSTQLILKATHYIGLANLDGQAALRVSYTRDLEGLGSHSILASWHPFDIVTDKAYIAAEIACFLGRQYSDFFLID